MPGTQYPSSLTLVVRLPGALCTVPLMVSQFSVAGLAAPSNAATSSSSISTLVTQVLSGIGWLATGEPQVTTCSNEYRSAMSEAIAAATMPPCECPISATGSSLPMPARSMASSTMRALSACIRCSGSLLINSTFCGQPNGESSLPSVPGIVTSHDDEPSAFRYSWMAIVPYSSPLFRSILPNRSSPNRRRFSIASATECDSRTTSVREYTCFTCRASPCNAPYNGAVTEAMPPAARLTSSVDSAPFKPPMPATFDANPDISPSWAQAVASSAWMPFGPPSASDPPMNPPSAMAAVAAAA